LPVGFSTGIKLWMAESCRVLLSFCSIVLYQYFQVLKLIKAVVIVLSTSIIRYYVEVLDLISNLNGSLCLAYSKF
jgi:hypothetical protein